LNAAAYLLHNHTIPLLAILFCAAKIYDFVLGFRIIFFAISSAAIRSERGMNGVLLQPGRKEERLLCPGLHLVTGWAEPPPPPASLRSTPAWSAFARD
jgi:hypothetical protein